MCRYLAKLGLDKEKQREKYLDDLVVRMDNGMIKVVTGVRRCGKKVTTPSQPMWGTSRTPSS
jgi:predicted AAA+ superfamily ATPase